MSRDPKGYLSAKCAIEDIRLAQLWTEIDELYKKRQASIDCLFSELDLNFSSYRLWHQLTVYLITFVKDESFKSGGLLEVSHAVRLFTCSQFLRSASSLPYTSAVRFVCKCFFLSS